MTRNLTGNRAPRHQADKRLCDNARPRQGILDFGLAKLPSGLQADDGITTDRPFDVVACRPFQCGDSWGLPRTCRRNKPEPRTWTLELTFFRLDSCSDEMVTGRQAFSEPSFVSTIEALLLGTPVAPVRLNPVVPPELERIIERSLEKDRRLRYQSATEVGAELRRLRRSIETRQMAVTRTARPDRHQGGEHRQSQGSSRRRSPSRQSFNGHRQELERACRSLSEGAAAPVGHEAVDDEKEREALILRPAPHRRGGTQRGSRGDRPARRRADESASDS